MADEGKEEVAGKEAKAEVTAPEPSVFEKYRERINAGEEGVFSQEEEEAGAEEEPPEGAEAAEEKGDVDEEAAGEEAEAKADEAGEEDAAAGEGGHEAGEGEGVEAEAGDDDALTVHLPGRNPGEVFDIEAPDQETAERLNQLNNGFMRGEEARKAQASVQSDRDEIEEIDTALATDPAGFILDKVGKDFKLDVARALLLEPEIYEALQKEMEGYGDDNERELAHLKNKESRREKSDKATAEVQRGKAARAEVQKVHDTLKAEMPDGLGDEDALAYERMGMGLAQSVSSKLGRILTQAELVTALKEDRAVVNFLKGATKASPPRKKGQGAGSDSGSGEKPDKAQDRVDSLKKGKVRRKAVAGSSPAGVGAPPAAAALPKNQSVEDRIKHVRSKGLGNILRGGKKGRG